MPKYNSEFERYIFQQATQKEGENLDRFCTILQQLSVNCDFTEGTVENEVKTQMIYRYTSKSMRTNHRKDFLVARARVSIVVASTRMKIGVLQNIVVDINVNNMDTTRNFVSEKCREETNMTSGTRSREIKQI